MARRLRATEHGRVVLMSRRLRLMLLPVAAHDGEALFVRHVSLASLRAMLAQRVFIVLISAIGV